MSVGVRKHFEVSLPPLDSILSWFSVGKELFPSKLICHNCQPKVSLHGLKVLPHPSFSFSHYYSCTAIGLPVPASCQQRPTSQTSSIILSWHIPLPPVSIIWFTPMTSTNYLKAKETCGHLLLVDAFTLNVPILPQNAAPGAALVAADCFTGWMG